MKVDKVDNVDEVAVSRGLFIASFSAFIFTSLFSIALAGSGLMGGNETATAYYSSKVKANKVHAAQVVSSGTGTKPTVTLSISPTSVPQGVPTRVVLTWSSTNASKCLVKKNGVMFIDNLLVGSAPVNESSSATFTLDCTGNGGTASASANLTTTAATPNTPPPTNPNTNVSIAQGPTTVTISANPSRIAKGASSNIIFTLTSNLTGCLITKNNTETPNSPFLKPEFSRNDGISSGPLNSNTTFTISCTGKVDKKEYKAQTSVTVDAAPTAAQQKVETNLIVTPTTINPNGSVSITWTSKYADSCVLSKSNFDANGKIVNKTTINTQLNASNVSSGALSQTTKFMLECRNSLGADVSFVDVKVGTVTPPPTTPTGDKPAVTINTNPTAVNANGEVLVSYASKYADSCVVTKANISNLANKTQFSTLPYASNMKSGALTADTRFLLECKNKFGTSSAYADVKVNVVTPTGDKPAVTINTNPTAVNANGEVLVSYASKYADSCVVTKANVDAAGNLTNKTQFATLPYASNMKSGALTGNTRFLLECKNKVGTASAYADVKVNTVTPPPVAEPVLKITANPMQVTAGQTSSITWSATNVESCNVYSDVYSAGGNKLWKSGLTGTNVTSLPIAKDIGYQLSCLKNGKSVSAYVLIKATPAADALTAKIWADPTTVGIGQTTNIYWTSTGATFCNVYENDGNTLWKTGLTGTKVVTLPLTKDRQYTLSCTKNGTTVASYVVVKAQNPQSTVRPTAKITVANAEVKPGASTNVTWTSTGANKCIVTKGQYSESTLTSGTVSTGALKESTVYWITCTNNVGSYSDAVTIQVK